MTSKRTHPNALDTTGATADEAAIIEIERAMSEAQRVDEITDHWAEEAAYYDFGEGSFAGRDAAKAEIAEQFKGVTNLRTQVLELTVHAHGEAAWAHSLQNFIADSTAGGPVLNFVFRETDTFIKRDGRWLLAHQHLSVPVDFSTGAVVLKSALPDPLK